MIHDWVCIGFVDVAMPFGGLLYGWICVGWGRQQMRQKRTQMGAGHAHACTLYVRRLIPMGTMDVRTLQGGQKGFFVRSKTKTNAAPV